MGEALRSKAHDHAEPKPSDRFGPRGETVTHTGEMGFNPHRQYRRTTADYVMVAAAILVCLALVAWAFFG